MPGQEWQLHPKHFARNEFQAKTLESGDWHGHHLFEIHLGRNYSMFAALAGVRGGPPMISPRGFPDTASPALKQAWEDNGEHTPSYLSVKELKRCINHRYKMIYQKRRYKSRKTVINIFENPRPGKEWGRCVSYQDVVAYCEKFIKDNSITAIDGLIDIKPEVRLVFWFDS